MRRLTLAAIAAVMALAVVAVSASARIDHHFSVDLRISEGVFEGTDTSFRIRAPLTATFNDENKVGRLAIRCKSSRPDSKDRCVGLIHLTGDVGGSGFIYLRGNLGGSDDALNITGGTDDFHGAAGKVVAPRNRLHIDVIR